MLVLVPRVCEEPWVTGRLMGWVGIVEEIASHPLKLVEVSRKVFWKSFGVVDVHDVGETPTT